MSSGENHRHPVIEKMVPVEGVTVRIKGKPVPASDVIFTRVEKVTIEPYTCKVYLKGTTGIDAAYDDPIEIEAREKGQPASAAGTLFRGLVDGGAAPAPSQEVKVKAISVRATDYLRGDQLREAPDPLEMMKYVIEPGFYLQMMRTLILASQYADNTGNSRFRNVHRVDLMPEKLRTVKSERIIPNIVGWVVIRRTLAASPGGAAANIAKFTQQLKDLSDHIYNDTNDSTPGVVDTPSGREFHNPTSKTLLRFQEAFQKAVSARVWPTMQDDSIAKKVKFKLAPFYVYVDPDAVVANEKQRHLEVPVPDQLDD